ncbi:hypothetical protein H0H93_009417 [Arthromyces matolae]|nr:hypothetical protein H0H93_009417 [Arthromyces matolae]
MFPFTALLLIVPLQSLAQYSATYLPSNAPAQSEQGQAGTNRCGSNFNQSSNCQNAYINSVTDWCIWAPPNPGPDSVIGNTEDYVLTLQLMQTLHRMARARASSPTAPSQAHTLFKPRISFRSQVSDDTRFTPPRPTQPSVQLIRSNE